MSKRLIVQQEKHCVSFVLDYMSVSSAIAKQEFVNPLKEKDLQDIRWYIEDYLSLPYGVWQDRGRKIADRLDQVGKALFECLFGEGKPGREAYIQIKDDENWELWLSSADPTFLGLPWELMRDPAKQVPLPLSMAGFTRTLPGEAGAVEVPATATLRVLMVIARPLGDKDAGYRAVARPLFEKLPAIGGRVEIELCRPPTFEQLKTLLLEAHRKERPYNIVHFDGHGGFGPTLDPETLEESEQGYLFFEGAREEDRQIRPDALGNLLGASGVPLVVFNACRSGQQGVGVGPEASIATRLIQSGTAAVVAMGYRFYVKAAAEFVAAFYEDLFAGKPVASAITRGRRRLRDRPVRPTPRGGMPLEDWWVPVLYGRCEVMFSHLRSDLDPTADRPPVDAALDAVAGNGAHLEDGVSDPLSAVGQRFFGRDRYFYHFEQAIAPKTDTGFLASPVLLLHGQGGIGKTECAKAYARWLVDTGWVQHLDIGGVGVVHHSFGSGTVRQPLDQLTSQVGLALFGPEFALRTKGGADRAALILNVLREHRIVLILDGFESLVTMPPRAQASLPLDEIESLQAFLAAASNAARSLVIITSRTAERWLDEKSQKSPVQLKRLPLYGLPGEESSEYIDVLLARLPKAQTRRREDTNARALLDCLGGNPLCLRVVMPMLQDAQAAELLHVLSGEAPPQYSSTGARSFVGLSLLDQCVEYSFKHLTPRDGCRSRVLALFQTFVEAGILAVISESDNMPSDLHRLPHDDWRLLLSTLSQLGLITAVPRGYAVHPALPRYLINRWRMDAKERFPLEWDALTCSYILAMTKFGEWVAGPAKKHDPAHVFALLGSHHPNLRRALSAALNRKLFSQARTLAWTLSVWWRKNSLFTEVDDFIHRIRLATEETAGIPPSQGTEASALWIQAMYMKAGRLIDSGRPEEAAACHKMILEASRGSKTESIHQSRAFGAFGGAALMRGAFGEAQDWFQKADQSRAQSQGLGSQREKPANPYLTGFLAQQQQDHERAVPHLHEARTRAEKLNDLLGVYAADYQLANAYLHLKKFGEAEKHSRIALAFARRNNLKRELAMSNNQSSSILLARGALDAAETHARRALGVAAPLGLTTEMAHSYVGLGAITERRRGKGEGVEWSIKAVALFDDFPNKSAGDAAINIARFAIAFGLAALEEKWLETEQCAIPKKVKAVLSWRLAEEATKKGELSTAESLLKGALDVADELSDWQLQGVVTYGLGELADARREHREAEALYQRSAAIADANASGLALVRGQSHFGWLAQKRGEFGDAVAWFEKAFKNAAAGGFRYEEGVIAHARGEVARLVGDNEGAVHWFLTSLSIKEAMEDVEGATKTYLSLAATEEKRQELEKADQWCCKALNAARSRGDQGDLALAHCVRGVVQSQRGEHTAALESFVRSVCYFDRFPDPRTDRAPQNLVIIANALGMGALENAWHQVTGNPLPANVRTFVEKGGKG